MSLADARLILDTARAGGAIPMHLITEALGVTGDLSTRPPAPSLQAIVYAWPEFTQPAEPEVESVELDRAWPYYATPTGQAA